MVVLASGTARLEVSLRCPQVQLGDGAGSFGGDLPTQIDRRMPADGKWECRYEPVKLPGETELERVLCAEWSAGEGVLRKWLRLRVISGDTMPRVDEIVFESLDASRLTREFQPGPPQSYPVFLSGFFAGIEFPVASTRVEDRRAILGHRPLCTLLPNTWYESRRAVYGPAPRVGKSWPSISTSRSTGRRRRGCTSTTTRGGLRPYRSANPTSSD